MPRGIPNKRPITIDVDPPPLGRAGTDRKVQRLMVEYGEKYHALRIVNDLLIEDEQRRAIEAGPQKLLAATTMRNGYQHNGNGRDPNTLDSMGRRLGRRVSAAPKQPKPSTSGKKYKRGKNNYGITGKALTMFLLGTMSMDVMITKVDMIQALQKSGYPFPDSIRPLNGMVDGSLVTRGYVKKSVDGRGFKLTAKGRDRLVEMRAAHGVEGQPAQHAAH